MHQHDERADGHFSKVSKRHAGVLPSGRRRSWKRRERSHEIDSEGSVSCGGELTANAERVYSRGCGRQRFFWWWAVWIGGGVLLNGVAAASRDRDRDGLRSRRDAWVLLGRSAGRTSSCLDSGIRAFGEVCALTTNFTLSRLHGGSCRIERKRLHWKDSFSKSPVAISGMATGFM